MNWEAPSVLGWGSSQIQAHKDSNPILARWGKCLKNANA
jgi:hypothetical protein